ncbi:MAG: glycosyltransferase [Bryobacteraceae bacterium]
MSFWCWLIAGSAALVALASLRGERRRAAYAKACLAERATTLPPATVIVPIKGDDEGLRDNLAALTALDYPDYELLVAAQTAADIPPGVLPRQVKVVLARGGSAEASEKVQNLMAAVAAARRGSTVFAFADSDVRVTAGWLRALAAPLEEPGVGASTGYRFFVPQPAGAWSLLRGVWDGAAFGLLGPGDNPFAWGGSMAIRRELFFAAGVPERWATAISDDYALSDAVHRAGLRIAFAPGALAASPERITARRFFAWSRRQMLLTRVYAPRLWWAAFAAHALYCGGMAVAASAWLRGSAAAPWLLAAQLLPGMAKGFLRTRRARSSLPTEAAWFRRWGWTHTLLAPLVAWLWLVTLLTSAFGSSIDWRGRKYRLRRAP